MERFPLDLVRAPTAVTNRDARDVYNNVILFTVQGDNSNGSPAEMHIFHVLSGPAQRIVDDIKDSQARLRGGGAGGREMTADYRRQAEERREGVRNRIDEYEKYAQHNSSKLPPARLLLPIAHPPLSPSRPFSYTTLTL